MVGLVAKWKQGRVVDREIVVVLASRLLKWRVGIELIVSGGWANNGETMGRSQKENGMS